MSDSMVNEEDNVLEWNKAYMEDNRANFIQSEIDKEAKHAEKDANCENYKCQEASIVGESIQHAGDTKVDDQDKIINAAEKAAQETREKNIITPVGDIHSIFPKQANLLALEMDDSRREVNSNPFPDLDSLVEDSQGPILEALPNKDIPQSSEARLIEKSAQEKLQKRVGSNTAAWNSPIVIGSKNIIRASQLQSIYLQVELNPKEARKKLKSRISEECQESNGSAFWVFISGLFSFVVLWVWLCLVIALSNC